MNAGYVEFTISLNEQCGVFERHLLRISNMINVAWHGMEMGIEAVGSDILGLLLGGALRFGKVIKSRFMTPVCSIVRKEGRDWR